MNPNGKIDSFYYWPGEDGGFSASRVEITPRRRTEDANEILALLGGDLRAPVIPASATNNRERARLSSSPPRQRMPAPEPASGRQVSPIEIVILRKTHPQVMLNLREMTDLMDEVESRVFEESDICLQFKGVDRDVDRGLLSFFCVTLATVEWLREQIEALQREGYPIRIQSLRDQEPPPQQQPSREQIFMEQQKSREQQHFVEPPRRTKLYVCLPQAPDEIKMLMYRMEQQIDGLSTRNWAVQREQGGGNGWNGYIFEVDERSERILAKMGYVVVLSNQTIRFRPGN